MQKQKQKAAIKLAQKGFRVFRIAENSKLPFDRDWATSATSDPQKAADLFAKGNYNVGVLTTGLVVIDVDTKGKADGRAWLASARASGLIGETYSVATPSGGSHIYYRGDQGQSPIAPGVDVRSRNGYVLGAGSTIDGRTYTETDSGPVADIPPALAAMCSRPKTRRTGGPLVPDGVSHPAALLAAVRRAQEAPPVYHGQRNHSAYKMAAAIKDLGVAQADCLDVLLLHWNDRCEPPLDLDELAHCVRSAYRYGALQAGTESPALDFDDITATAETAIDEDAPLFVPLNAKIKPEEIPPRNWLVDKYIMRGNLSLILAPGGTGKSSLSMLLALLGCKAKVKSGFRVRSKFKTLIINNEDDYDEMHRRFLATCEANNVEPAIANENIFIMDKNASPFCAVGRSAKTRRLRATQQFHMLEKFIDENNIDLVIFDPFAEMHEADENSNTEMAAVVSRFRHLTVAKNIAGLNIHHTRKPGEGRTVAGNADMSRGASAIVNSHRRALTLAHATPADAAAMGLTTKERRRLVRVDGAKGNYTGQDDAPVWLEHTSVTLANGDAVAGFRPADMGERLQDGAQKIATLLLPYLTMESKPLALSACAELICADLEYSEAEPADMAKTLRRVFARPVDCDGYTVQLTEITTKAGLIRHALEAKTDGA